MENTSRTFELCPTDTNQATCYTAEDLGTHFSRDDGATWIKKTLSPYFIARLKKVIP